TAQATIATTTEGTGAVTVTGPQGGPFTVTFGGSLAGQDIAQIGSSTAGVATTATVINGSANATVRAQVSATSPNFLVDVYFGGALARANLNTLTAANVSLTGTGASVAASGVADGINTGLERQSLT